MSIKLDWEIEAEQEQIRGAGEDPDARRRRRRVRIRFAITLLILLSLIGGVVGAIYLRLRQADWQIEQLLRDTVDAEVAALRIGNRELFLDIQRSATDDWIQRQAAEFDRYQSLKATQDVNLTGRIVDLQVDRLRARVIVEEIIGGVPYGRAWFYWRYGDDGSDQDNQEDGWRHVPPDYTFWGEVRSIASETVTVRYRAVDETIAGAIHADLSRWIAEGCAALQCPTLPMLNVEIEPDAALQTSWAESDPWTLRLRSPFVVAGRLDQPFDRALKLEVSRLMAERLVQWTRDIQPIYPNDAVFLRTAIINWLMGRFSEIDTGSHLVESLAQTYGDQTVGVLLQILAPDSSVAVVGTAAGAPSLEQAAVDWRDFLTWRLNVEGELVARGDVAGVTALYTDDDYGRALAASRIAAGAPSEARSVVSVIRETDSTGVPVLRAVVQIGESDSGEEILFRLSSGVWRRAS